MENEEDLFVFQGERAVSVAPSQAVPRHRKLTDCRRWIAKGSCSNGRRSGLSGIKSNEKAGVPDGEKKQEVRVLKQNLGQRVFEESELTLCFKNCQRNFIGKKKYLSTGVLLSSSLSMFQAQRFRLGDESPYVHTKKNRTPLQLEGKRRVLVAGARKQVQKKDSVHTHTVCKGEKHFPPMPRNENDGRTASIGDKKKLYVLFFSCGGKIAVPSGYNWHGCRWTSANETKTLDRIPEKKVSHPSS